MESEMELRPTLEENLASQPPFIQRRMAMLALAGFRFRRRWDSPDAWSAISPGGEAVGGDHFTSDIAHTTFLAMEHYWMAQGDTNECNTRGTRKDPFEQGIGKGLC